MEYISLIFILCDFAIRNSLGALPIVIKHTGISDIGIFRRLWISLNNFESIFAFKGQATICL